MIIRLFEFRRMIWDNDVRVIIMFDDSQIELERCFSNVYWPEEYVEMYGNIEVSLVGTSSFAFYIRRVFSVRCITNENVNSKSVDFVLPREKKTSI